MTLKPGLEVVQGHLKWRRSIDCIRVPIVVFFSNIMILLEVNEFKKRFETVTFIITKNVFFSLQVLFRCDSDSTCGKQQGLFKMKKKYRK